MKHEAPKYVNCSEAHTSDSTSCTVYLRQLITVYNARAVEIPVSVKKPVASLYIDETSSYPRLTFVEWATIVRSLWINSSTLRIRMSYASMKRKRTWLAINSIITPWYQLSMETTAKVLPCLYIPAFLIYENMISKIFILTAFGLWLC